MKVAVWLGSEPPLRSIRWLDGALAAAAKLGDATAIAAGEPAWLELVHDRATRATIGSASVPTTMLLDYLGWAQIAAAVARHLGATFVVVDEASRASRWAEVAAIAEILDAAQLTRVIEIAPDGDHVQATRIAGTQLQRMRLHAPAVIGVCIAGAAVDDPLPAPAAGAGTRLELSAIGLDPIVLGHRALPPRSPITTPQTIQQITDYLAVHLVPRSEGR